MTTVCIETKKVFCLCYEINCIHCSLVVYFKDKIDNILLKLKERHFHDCFLTHLSRLLKSALCNKVNLKNLV